MKLLLLAILVAASNASTRYWQKPISLDENGPIVIRGADGKVIVVPPTSVSKGIEMVIPQPWSQWSSLKMSPIVQPSPLSGLGIVNDLEYRNLLKQIYYLTQNGEVDPSIWNVLQDPLVKATVIQELQEQSGDTLGWETLGDVSQDQQWPLWNKFGQGPKTVGPLPQTSIARGINWNQAPWWLGKNYYVPQASNQLGQTTWGGSSWPYGYNMMMKTEFPSVQHLKGLTTPFSLKSLMLNQYPTGIMNENGAGKLVNLPRVIMV